MAKENNGGAGKVIFVVSFHAILCTSDVNSRTNQDTEGTFRPKENIVPIAERFGIPNRIKQILSNSYGNNSG